MDVPFLTGGVQTKNALAVAPAELMAGLAGAPEARMRSALIPLFLRHPEFAEEARMAAARLDEQLLYTLELFYTAAMVLQKEYKVRLGKLFGAQARLPDWFSESLGLELKEEVAEALVRVGERHAELSGLNMNWTGGYEHAARTWLEYMELRQERENQQGVAQFARYRTRCSNDPTRLDSR